MKTTIKKILIANRSEIACRIIKTSDKMGIETVAVYSDADADSLHVELATEAVNIGPAAPSESYLNIDKIIKAAKDTGADAIHPGYGFLSENSSFIKACEDNGLVFIGPNSKAVDVLGSKTESRKMMIAAGVPVVPGLEQVDVDDPNLLADVRKIGYPVMVKAASGGGGKGMRRVDNETDLKDAILSASREAKKSFGDATVFIEKFVENPRHIEIQVITDKHGHAIHLYERECSIQRRHQKIIEEAPSAILSEKQREEMGQAAIKAVTSVGYDSVGTVEFLYAPDGEFYFLEVNTRVQVEHPVTEEITGIDIIEQQINIASGESLAIKQNDVKRKGHSIECRIYAEDGDNGFLPSGGKVKLLKVPTENYVRFDTGIEEGSVIDTYYDPIMAKLIVWGENRQQAIDRMRESLEKLVLFGVKTSVGFMHRVISHDSFIAGDLTTGFIEQYESELKVSKDNEMLAAAALAAFISKAQSKKSHPISPADNVWQQTVGFEIGKL